MHKLLGSSIDSQKLSLTIKSAVPLVVFLVLAFKLDITEGMIEEYATALASAVTACFTLYGLSRKIWIRIKK